MASAFHNNPHDLRNVKQMANKTDIYQKNRPRRSLSLNPSKSYNRVDLNRNSIQTNLYLTVVTLCYHSPNRIIYDCQRSANMPREKYTQGKIFGYREYQLTTHDLTPKLE